MAKGGGKANNEDWACCEQCSFCFTIFVGILFFLAGGAMTVYSALFLFSDIYVNISGLELLDTDAIQYAIFIIGLAIAGTALLGMVSACCAKCAANPDGKCDCCEQCCTAVLSIIYIIILVVLLIATLAIAGVLSYFAVILFDTTSNPCPYPEGSDLTFTAGETNAPDPVTCPIDYAMWNSFYFVNVSNTAAGVAWTVAQDSTVTCGYYCDAYDGNYCSPSLGAAYAPQLTGTFCTTNVTSDVPQNDATIYQGTINGTAQAFRTGEPSTMPYRPTFLVILRDVVIIPFLAVWWCIFVFALLLIIAACVMCIRKKKMTKESTYKPK